MADLSVRYLGLGLSNPLVVAASGLTASSAGVRKAAEAGAGAVVLKSLFEEQLEAEVAGAAASLEAGAHPEAADFLSRAGWAEGAAEYLALVREAKAAAGAVPVIASVNCRGEPAWAEYAARIAESGADALELNIAFMPVSTEERGAEIEERVVRVVSGVRKSTGLPLAVKLGPGYTSLPNLARSLAGAGAGALVLFNRFFRLDIDLDTLAPSPGPQRSSREDYHESLRWISILYDRVGCELASGTGVHDAEAALKLVLAGASTVQLCSAIYQHGWGVIGEIKHDMAAWLEGRGEASLAALRGRLCQWRSGDPDRYLRLQYIKALTGIS